MLYRGTNLKSVRSKIRFFRVSHREMLYLYIDWGFLIAPVGLVIYISDGVVMSRRDLI
jgi:hypothetical protein